MKRLTTNKDVSEMSMAELAHNSCYAKEHEARYRDYGMDIDARELTIKLLDKFAKIPNEFTCDEDFDEFITGVAQYGIYDILGFIAIFYRNLWAMADLRERLKEYENLELTPDQLKEISKQYTEKCSQIKEIVKRLEKEAEEARAGGHPEISGAYRIAIWTIKDITGIGGLSDEQRYIISWEKD